MTPGAAVKPVTESQHNGTCHRERPIRRNTKLVVHYCAAKAEQQHASYARDNNSKVSVLAKTKGKGAGAQWKHNDQHLRVEVTVGQLTQERCRENQKRQRQAMHHAQARQQNSGPIEQSRCS